MTYMAAIIRTEYSWLYVQLSCFDTLVSSRPWVLVLGCWFDLSLTYYIISYIYLD